MAGKQVLILVDEALIATAMQQLAENAGWSVLGPFAAVGPALRAIEAGAEIGCALLDCNLGGAAPWPVAEILAARGTPFAFTSGDGARGMDPRFASRPIFAKPVDEDLVRRFLSDAAAH